MVITSPSVKSLGSPPTNMYAESRRKHCTVGSNTTQYLREDAPLYSSCHDPFEPSSNSLSLILLISLTTLDVRRVLERVYTRDHGDLLHRCGCWRNVIGDAAPAGSRLRA